MSSASEDVSIAIVATVAILCLYSSCSQQYENNIKRSYIERGMCEHGKDNWQPCQNKESYP